MNSVADFYNSFLFYFFVRCVQSDPLRGTAISLYCSSLWKHLLMVASVRFLVCASRTLMWITDGSMLTR
jgi:hypothetical protein